MLPGGEKKVQWETSSSTSTSRGTNDEARGINETLFKIKSVVLTSRRNDGKQYLSESGF